MLLLSSRPICPSLTPPNPGERGTLTSGDPTPVLSRAGAEDRMRIGLQKLRGVAFPAPRGGLRGAGPLVQGARDTGPLPVPVSSSRLTAPLPARRLQRRPSAYCAWERPSGRCSPHTPGQASPGSVSLPPLVSRALSPPGGEWGWGAMRSRSARSRSRADAMRRVRPRDKERWPPPGIQQISCRQSDVSRRPERSVSERSAATPPAPVSAFPPHCAPAPRSLASAGEERVRYRKPPASLALSGAGWWLWLRPARPASAVARGLCPVPGLLQITPELGGSKPGLCKGPEWLLWLRGLQHRGACGAQGMRGPNGCPQGRAGARPVGRGRPRPGLVTSPPFRSQAVCPTGRLETAPVHGHADEPGLRAGPVTSPARGGVAFASLPDGWTDTATTFPVRLRKIPVTSVPGVAMLTTLAPIPLRHESQNAAGPCLGGVTPSARSPPSLLTPGHPVRCVPGAAILNRPSVSVDCFCFDHGERLLVFLYLILLIGHNRFLEIGSNTG
uniref:uncharacterized protein LOC118546110 n=1 Tax=Halichoerus grypus TaxID=9711 RepID=UPI0016590211|nr:uncharacterized protein LOC118546110 [Halichoerus grypus]